MGRGHVPRAEETRKVWENPWVPVGSWLETQDVGTLSRAGVRGQGLGEREGKGAEKWDGARGRGGVGEEKAPGKGRARGGGRSPEPST